MTAAHDYSDLHELIDRLEPAQAEELRKLARRLVQPTVRPFKVLRPFSGPRAETEANCGRGTGDG